MLKKTMLKKLEIRPNEHYYKLLQERIEDYETQVDGVMMSLDFSDTRKWGSHVLINGVRVDFKRLLLAVWNLKQEKDRPRYRLRFLHCLDVSVGFHRESLLNAECLLRSLPGAKMPRRPKELSKKLAEIERAEPRYGSTG